MREREGKERIIEVNEMSTISIIYDNNIIFYE